MIRGTTPTFSLIINDQTLDLTQCLNVYVTFKQRDKALVKTGDDITVTAQQVDVYLSQEETLSFVAGSLQVQLNWTYIEGRRACTQIKTIDIGENLLPKVIE